MQSMPWNDSAMLKEEWQLSVDEVHPRYSLNGFQLAPNSELLSFLMRRDVPGQGEGAVSSRQIADLYVIGAEGGYPQQLTITGDIRSPAHWSPDGTKLVFHRGNKLQIMPATGGKVITIYEGEPYHPRLAKGDIEYAGYPVWSPSGDFILFATRENNGTALRLVSSDGSIHRRLTATEENMISWNWSFDGRRILFVTRSENGWSGHVCVCEFESGKSGILWKEDNFEYQRPIAVWVPDGQHILFRSNRSGWSKLWIAPLDKLQEPTPLTDGEWDDYAFRIEPRGHQVVYASREQQPGTGDDLWVVTLDKQRRRLTYHSGVNVPLAVSNDNRVFYWHSSPTEPGDLWVTKLEGDETTRLTRSAPIELERKLRPPKEVTVSNADGTNVPTLIYFPAFYQEGERYPAIVWIRGGPISVARDFYPFYNWLANQGFIVVVPNYRGSIGFGIRHMVAVSGDGVGKNDLSDVLAAGDYAKTLPFVDVSRGLGVGGRSWGGYLALMAITQSPEAFSCAVAGAAISDWSIQQAQTEVRYYDYWLLDGWLYEQLQRAVERSPVNFVEQIKVPLLVYHGEKDNDVPFRQIEEFVKKARQVGLKIDFVPYPDEGHSNKSPQHQQDELGRVGAFFRTYLQSWNFHDNPSANQIQY